MKRPRRRHADSEQAQTPHHDQPALASTPRWRRCGADDIALDEQWRSRDQAYCLDTGDSDLWTQVLEDRGWKNAGPLCESNDEAREIVAGTRLPPVAARRRCLYLTLLPDEINILCRIPKQDRRWKLSLFPGIAAACTKSATAAQFASSRSPGARTGLQASCCHTIAPL